MAKFGLLATVLALVTASPALAGGQPSKLGLNWTSAAEVVVSPSDDEAGDEGGDEPDAVRRPRATTLGVNGRRVIICYSNNTCVQY